jgi:Tfp pilus assembly protein PilV
MLRSTCSIRIKRCNNRGVGLIEVLIAIFLTAVGIMALLSLQPLGWSTTAKSDYMGRASGILYKTLEDYENKILNPCNAIMLGDQAEAKIQVSGKDVAIAGDIIYTVNTTIAQDGANPRAFLVTVTVAWTNSTTGASSSIAESLAIARQELFRFPAGCPNA